MANEFDIVLLSYNERRRIGAGIISRDDQGMLRAAICLEAMTGDWPVAEASFADGCRGAVLHGNAMTPLASGHKNVSCRMPNNSLISRNFERQR